MVKLILRDKEYEVKPGMNLLAALKKCDIIPESVIATRDGEMILDDEILKDGDVVRLVAVISGGASSLRVFEKQSSIGSEIALWRRGATRNDRDDYEM